MRGLAHAVADMRGRIADLETQLSDATVRAESVPMLEAQIAGLKERSERAEKAALFADTQLQDLIAEVDASEAREIRRAAAAEAARIRELTEDSLGIAREATVGTGLDGDDFPTPPPVELNQDLEDWSDVFAAADYLAEAERTQPVIDPEVARLAEETVRAADEAADDPEVGNEAAVDEPAPEAMAQSDVPADVQPEDLEETDPDAGVAPESASADSDVDAAEQNVDVPEQFADELEAGVQVEEPEGTEELRAVQDDIAAKDGATDDEPVSEAPVAAEFSHPEGVDLVEAEFASSDVAAPDASAESLETSGTDDPLPSVADDDVPTEASVADASPSAVEAQEEAEPASPLSALLGRRVSADDESNRSHIEPEAEADVEAEVEANARAVPDAPIVARAEPSEEASRPAQDPEPLGEQPVPAGMAAIDNVDATVAESFGQPAPVSEAADEAAEDEAAVGEPVATMSMAEKLRLARAELDAELDPEMEQPQPLDYGPDANGDFPTDIPFRRQSGETRYSRQSARLPRIGESEDGDTEIGSMSRLRAKMLRGKKGG